MRPTLTFVPGIVVHVDCKENITFINSDGESILEKPTEEIIGQNWFDRFIPTRNKRSVQSLFDRVRRNKTQEAWKRDFPIETPTGHIRHVRWNICPLKDRTKKVVGVQFAGVDLSTQIQMEHESTAKKKMADIGEAATDIAHDLNNLLTSIIGYSNLLMERTNLDPTYKDDLSEIRTEALRAAALTHRLIRMGRSEKKSPR